MTDTTGIFRSGELLLPTGAPETAVAAAAQPCLLETILILASVFTLMLLLSSIFNAVPAVVRSFTRLRGASNLEGSVRTARDRNITALVLLLPFVLVVGRTGLYSPAFLAPYGPDLRLALLCGVMAAYLLLRVILYVILKPRRGQDGFALARRAVWNSFILLCLLLLPTVGILGLCGVDETVIRLVVFVEITFFYALAVLRRGNILLSVCNPLTTFLYLCGLEFLPTGLLVASALVL